VLSEHRSRADSLRWVAQGTAHFSGAMATMPDRRLEQATTLPGWTGRHLLAHVAANADALVNLATWARTGVQTPMYASPSQRDEEIESGSRRPLAELRSWVAGSAAALDVALGRLGSAHWERAVRTAQGRTVPASEITWLRAREVMIHAVDLGAGVGFDDLPAGFLAALIDDITARRTAAGDGPALTLAATDHFGTWRVAGPGEPTAVIGTVAGLAAYLAGRPTRGVAGAPALPRWL
jgi:maleylpyruvate isomerase